MHRRVFLPRVLIVTAFCLLSGCGGASDRGGVELGGEVEPVGEEKSAPEDSADERARSLLANLPLYFIENRGQTDRRALYVSHAGDTTLYFARGGLRWSFAGPSERWTVAAEHWRGRQVRPRGRERTSAIVSYFKGSKASWKTGVPTYARVDYRNVWPGISIEYTSENGQLKSTYVVRPGADPARIRTLYRGAKSVAVDEDERGRLRVETPVRIIEEKQPVAYQMVDGRRVDVPVSHKVEQIGDGFVASFRVGEHSRGRILVIDPASLTYAGYIGGSGSDSGRAVAVDSSGNAYVAGNTSSTEATFPETVGPDLTYDGVTDGFIAKVNSAGTALDYCGYIGGSGNDIAYGIAVDSSGNAYVAGDTSSTEATFPETVGPDLTHNGGVFDAFVAKVNSAGTALDYCGYIGGSGGDVARDISVDSSGTAYVAGYTSSTEATFPEITGPDLTHNGGTDDAFVAKVNAGGTLLDYCGYIGGSGNDVAQSIAVDSSGNAYVTGNTTSTEATFPETGGPDLTYNGGTHDAFVAKVNSAGTGLDYCGYIGGSGVDVGRGIALDSSGNAYVAGQSDSTEATFPETGGPDLTQNGGTDAFVAKVNSGGTVLDYCGYIGGSGEDIAYGISVDSSGNAYVAGDTASSEATFPETGGPDLTYSGGALDGFIAKVNSGGSALNYCGYIGGSDEDSAFGISVDSSGNAYVTGQTSSTESTFPDKVGPDLTSNGSSDAFVAKVKSWVSGGIYVEDATSATTGSATATALSWSHDVSVASNQILMVGVSIANNSSQTVLSVTFGAQSFTSVGNVEVGGTVRSELWRLLAPTSGTGTITVNLSAAAKFVAGAVSLSEVHQTTPLGTFASATGTDTTPTVTVSSAATEVVIDTVAAAGTVTTSVGTGQTSQWTNVTSGGTDVRGSSSTEPGAGSVTMSYTLSGSASWAIGSVSVKPASTTAARLVSLSATRGQAVTAIEWQTGYEVDNLGWHVWREEAGRKQRITPGLVAGSALMVRARGELGSGRSYRWLDERRGTNARYWRYWIEEIELGGKRRWHGPVVATDGVTQGERSVLLAQVGRVDVPVRRVDVPAGRVATVRRHAKQAPIDVPAGTTLWVDNQDEGICTVAHDDPAGVRVLGDGEEVAVRASGDRIEFYCMGLDTPFTDRRAYWIVDHGPGRTMTELPPDAGNDLVLVDHFPVTLLRRDRSVYVAALRNGDAENLFGPIVTMEDAEQTFDVHHAAAGDGELEVRLQGLTSGAHEVLLEWNGKTVGKVAFFDQGTGVYRGTATVKAGENRLVLSSLGGDTDVSAVERVLLTYEHATTADDNKLVLTVAANRRVSVDGFDDPDVAAYDVTDAWQPVLLSAQVEKTTAGYTATVAVRGEDARKLIFTTEAAKLVPEVKPRTVVEPEKLAAQFVIISHEDFLKSALALAELRESEGWSVSVVDVQAIYDAFRFGEKHPGAIREFLAYAHGRGTTHVLLMGDASLDPRGFLGLGQHDFVPTVTVSTGLLETASDDALGDTDGDGIPDLRLGRLPVRTPDEADAIVSKIIGYTRPKGALFMVDDGFELLAERLRAALPEELAVAELHRGDDIESGLADGAFLAAYLGHGSVEVLGTNGWLDSKRAAALEMAHPPIFASFTCLNAFFHDVYTDSLGETLIRSPGGPIAVWASTGLTYPEPQAAMGEAFFRELFVDGGAPTLGDATARAKALAGDEDTRKTWVLLGDPTTPLVADAQTASPRVDSGCGCALAAVPSGSSRAPIAWLALSAILLLAHRRRPGKGRS